MWDTDCATLGTDCSDRLNGGETRLDRSLDKKGDEITLARAHLRTDDHGDAGNLRVTRTLRAIDAIVIGNGDVREAARRSSSHDTERIAERIEARARVAVKVDD